MGEAGNRQSSRLISAGGGYARLHKKLDMLLKHLIIQKQLLSVVQRHDHHGSRQFPSELHLAQTSNNCITSRAWSPQSEHCQHSPYNAQKWGKKKQHHISMNLAAFKTRQLSIKGLEGTCNEACGGLQSPWQCASTTGNLEEKSTEEDRLRRHSLHVSTRNDLQAASDRDSWAWIAHSYATVKETRVVPRPREWTFNVVAWIRSDLFFTSDLSVVFSVLLFFTYRSK